MTIKNFTVSNSFETTGVIGASIRPTLNLNFAKTKSLDPRITFTRASTATYFDAAGALRTAAAGVPRFDHDPVTGESLGLLIEEARTNLCTYSQDFTIGVWLTTTATKTTGVSDPFGGNTAATCTATSAGGILQNGSIAVVIGQTYTVSLWMRRRTGSGVVGLRAVENANNNPVTITSTWARYSATVTATTTIGRVGVYCSTSGDEVDIWGGQIELGTSSTSYIPTTTASATRAVDGASIPTAGWYIPNAGTMYCEFIPSHVLPPSGSTFVLVLDASGRFFYYNSAVGYAYDGVNIVTYSAISSNVRYKAIHALSSSNMFLCLNGGNVTTGAFDGTFGASTATLQIGQGGTGRIADIKYYPSRLSNTELQVLTDL